MMLLTPRRRARRSFRSIAALSASGLAAGAIAWWFLEPRRGGEHRRQAQEKVRTGTSRLGTKTRELGTKAAEAARTYQARASEGVRSLGDRARGAAEEARAVAGEGAASLEARGVPRDRTMTGTAAAILVLRAAMGGGLLRIPMALAGAALLSRVASESDGLKRGVTRTRDAARSAAGKLHAFGAGAEESGAHVAGGGGRRQPEVREVKSPGELDPGVASARPEPTFRDRVDRGGPHMGGGENGGGRRWDASADEDAVADAGLYAPGTEDVVGARAGFDAPEPGASVREDELGAVTPREARPEEEETPRIVGPGEGEPPRSASGPEGLDEVSPLIVGPDERPIGAGAGARDEPAPRIAGAEEEAPETRRSADRENAARKDPTSDGG